MFRYRLGVYIGLSLSLVMIWVGAGCAPAASPQETPDQTSEPTIPSPQPTAGSNRATTSPPATVEGSHNSGEPITPITTQLYMSQIPALQEQVELTFIISASQDAEVIDANLNLPDGAALISGETSWQGALNAGQSYTMAAAIEFQQAGNWTIEGKALSPQGDNNIWGDASYIYVYVAEEGSHLGFETDSNLIEDAEQIATPQSH